MSSYDVARNICQAHARPIMDTHCEDVNPLCLSQMTSYDAAASNICPALR